MRPGKTGTYMSIGMTKELLKKFLNNQCTELELKEVLEWMHSRALSDEGYKLGIDDWHKYEYQKSLDEDDKFVALFDRIQVEINTNEQLEKKQFKLHGAATYGILKGLVVRTAAVMLIPVLTFLFYTFSEMKVLTTELSLVATDTIEVIAPIGSRSVVELSDGTEVHLNFGSKIKYPRIFSGETRDVALVGEAYFDVTHNPDKPFVVKAGTLNVMAVGTAFNVQAYFDKDVVKTTLVNGKVVLERINFDGKTTNVGSMIPGQHVEFDTETGAINSSMGNIESFIAWKEGKIIFEDTPILEVTETLNRMFNVDIRVDKEIEDFVYSVTLVDEPLFQILDLMTIATPIRYEMLTRKKLPNGTYSKQEIIITKEANKK